VKLDTKDQRYEVCGQQKLEINGNPVHITLDSSPAVICGYGLDYAFVCDTVDHARKAEFAWSTVAHILTREDNPGAFKS
jgi:hypothetical protein